MSFWIPPRRETPESKKKGVIMNEKKLPEEKQLK